MKTRTVLILALCAPAAMAQDWSVGVATGPFVFGDFAHRTMFIGVEGPVEEQKATLSAATRPGLLVDIERNLGDRFAIRAEASFTRSPLSIKSSVSDNGFELESGDMDVGTFMLPLVLRINRNGALRFHVMGGPAYAGYRVVPRQNFGSAIRVFDETRYTWGWALGGGVAWFWTERVAVEGQITDITTDSPFRDDDQIGLGRFETPRTHNVHSTIGLRYRF